MKLAKESKEIDFVIKSEPWSEKEIADFRALMQKIKSKSQRKKISLSAKKSKPPEVNKDL